MLQLRNLFVTPDAVLEDLAALDAGGGKSSRVVVHGLLCHTVCVRRTQEALQGLPGVERVAFDAVSGTFTVRHRASLQAESVRNAVLEKVVFLTIRRLLGRLGYWLRAPLLARALDSSRLDRFTGTRSRWWSQGLERERVDAARHQPER